MQTRCPIVCWPVLAPAHEAVGKPVCPHRCPLTCQKGKPLRHSHLRTLKPDNAPLNHRMSRELAHKPLSIKEQPD